MSSEIIQVRVSSEMREEADSIFSSIGLKMGEAIRVFLQQSINSGGLPFQPHVKNPNSETISAMRESEDNKVEKTSLKNLRKEMGLDEK